MQNLLKIYYLIERIILKITLKKDNQEFTRKFLGNTFVCQNKWSYLSAIKEINIDECYKISNKIKIQSILDIGANLGFSVAYFKKQYPSSKIFAFEADPEIHRLLKHNININNFKDVSTFNGAAWIKDGTMEFYQDHGQGGSLLETNLHKGKTTIATFDIKKIIHQSDWDLLKIDVEGAEIEILNHIKDDIKKFKLIFIEFHADKTRTSKLSEILKLLEDNNFKYSFNPIFGSENLFNSYKSNDAFDLQLNIHAVRSDQIQLLN